MPVGVEHQELNLPDAAAIDFGASNTDAIAIRAGQRIEWSEPQHGAPDEAALRGVLAAGAVQPAQLTLLALTGGHHRALPDTLDGSRVVKVGELEAIGRGGQAMAAGLALPEEPLLVVSAGSGTAMVLARGTSYRHVTGTGVGGGTLLGLGRLLIDCADPVELDRLAQRGDSSAVDLVLRDVVTGPIGSLPPDATAVNFGKAARRTSSTRPEDLAAALVTLVGQVVATLAINAARAAGAQRIVVTGHVTDLPSLRSTMDRVGEFFGFPLETWPQAGYATALGALLVALER